jgi:1-acyl-sn-glycerol-3-phosphate acyltransferase
VLNRWLRRLARLLTRLVTRLDCTGLELIPASPPYIVVTDHLSVFDALVLAAIFPDVVRPFAAAKHRRNPIFRPILEIAGVVWVRRGEVDRGALRRALEVLARGEGLGVAPEGTRARGEYVLQRAKAGVAYLATRAKVPIVPVAVWGVELIKRNLPSLRRSAVSVRIGQPIQLPQSGRVERPKLDEYTDLIMQRIAGLLPKSYRGAYAPAPG